MDEPVAWMETYKGEPNNLDWDKNNLYCEGEFHNVVPLYTHQYQRPHNTVLVPCDKLAEMQAEIEALKSVVYWLKENRPEVWDDIQKWRKQ